MKTVVAIAFVLIIGSLASALFFLMRDKGRSNRTVQALAMRVGLSITLFLLGVAAVVRRLRTKWILIAIGGVIFLITAILTATIPFVFNRVISLKDGWVKELKKG